MVKLVSRPDAPPAAAADQVDEATSFADLAGEAELIDTGSAVPRTALATVPPDPVAAQARELLDVLTLARQIVKPMFAWWPEFGDVWADQQLASVADAGALVMDKHGWTTGAMFQEFGPYIALGMATVPPAIATHQAIKARKAQAAAEAQAKARAARNGDPQ